MQADKYIKRVIGVPGDRIEMIDDIDCTLTGNVYDEPYVKRIDGDPITDRITGNFTLAEITGARRKYLRALILYLAIIV